MPLLSRCCSVRVCVISLQGLLFKVNGVDPAAPVYGFLSGVMLTMCTVFLAWWLTVVVVSIARQLPSGNALLRRITGTLAGRSAKGRHGAGAHVLFAAPSSASGSGTTRRIRGGSVVAAAARVGADHSGDTVAGDNPSTAVSSDGRAVMSAVDKSNSSSASASALASLQIAEATADGGSMRFATVNPLRNKHQPSEAMGIEASESVAGTAGGVGAADDGSSERGRRVGRALLAHRA